MQTAERAGEVLAPQELGRYADAVVLACLGVRADDLLIVHAEPDHRELAVALAESGYRAGARLVEVVYADARVRAARLRHAPDEALGVVPEWELTRYREHPKASTALVTILGETDPGVLSGVPPERVAADHVRRMERLKPFRRAAQRGRRRWTGIAWPTPTWAERVYPELEPLEAQRRLARDLLWFCRLGPDDPPGFEGWLSHAARLVERGRRLTELTLASLELRGPGIRLDVRLAPGTLWLGGPRENAFGHVVTPNFPSEENFTSPHAAGTEGVFRCSRPLVFQRRVIEGIAGEFRRGRLVRLEAAREEDRELLAAFLAADPQAGRLGEIALVDRSSRIGQTGRVYWNTLIDENAVAHIAFGQSFGQTRVPGASRRGLNRANIHLDVMIGSDELEATGVTTDGRRIPLVAGGEWQV